MAKLVVSTFNCEWRGSNSPDAETIRKRTAGCDIVCFTETSSDFMHNDGFCAFLPLPPDPRNPSRRKVMLWSKNPWSEVSYGMSDLADYYVAGTTYSPIGLVRVHGVVIPYRFSGVRYGAPKRNIWQQHLRYLGFLDNVLENTPRGSILMGDFNQRIPRKYQPKTIYEALNRILLSRFHLSSGGVMGPDGSQAIDHICHSKDLKMHQIEMLSNIEKNRRISDHFGVKAIYKI